MSVTPTLVLLHGFTNTGASWEPVIRALAGQYRPLAPDIRGQGSAADAMPVTLADVIDDVAALVPAPERLTLVGYSMGGRIALHVALSLGVQVDRLVLISASPGLADAGERTARREADERLAAELEQLGIEQLAQRWARTPVLDGLAADVAARAHADRLRNTPAGLARSLRGLGTGALPPLWERLGELDLPITLITGARDTKFTAIAAEVAALLPDARQIVVPGAGHAVHLEAPEAVAEIIDTTRSVRR
jgi:2-succinyl-6-hydroxy-2,4-cyclohexadiene-1-carboxylate synthase